MAFHSANDDRYLIPSEKCPDGIVIYLNKEDFTVLLDLK
tara:strand:+ start:582 stop:698 length:117 start_codon:yes stop_codon:yes gene_type:complete